MAIESRRTSAAWGSAVRWLASTKERIDVDIRQLTDVLHCKLQQHC
jgi:hypothetical protein